MSINNGFEIYGFDNLEYYKSEIHNKLLFIAAT